MSEKILCLRCGKRYVNGSMSDVNCQCSETAEAYRRNKTMLDAVKPPVLTQEMFNELADEWAKSRQGKL